MADMAPAAAEVQEVVDEVQEIAHRPRDHLQESKVS